MQIKLFYFFVLLLTFSPLLSNAQQTPPIARPQVEISDYVLIKNDVPPEWEWTSPQAEESVQQTQIAVGGKTETQWLWRMYIGQILMWRTPQMKSRGAQGIAVQIAGAVFAKPETARAMWETIKKNNQNWLIEPSAAHDYSNFYLRPTAEKFGDEAFQVCEKNVMTNAEERTPHYLFLAGNSIYFVRSTDYYFRRPEYYAANDAVLRRLAAKLAKAPLPISNGGATSTPSEKLNKILSLYFSKIPKGILSSGSETNAKWWWDRAKYDPYLCGGYQSKVLSLLDALRFSLDPAERDLVTDFDYGPIHAFEGGHQAVVIYPKGTDWEKTGIVLDPWVEQKPKTYTMSEWKNIFPSGVGPSGVYKEKAEPSYPIVGGKYENPFQRPLTGEENTWFSNMPLAQKQALFGGITDIGERHLRIKYEYARRNLNTKVIADCPLNVYLVDAAGRVSGFPDGRFRAEIPGVTVLRMAKPDGTFWTQIEYPRDAAVELKMKGTAAGRAIVYNGFNMNDEFPKRSIYQYELQIESDQEFSLDQKQEGAKMTATAPKNNQPPPPQSTPANTTPASTPITKPNATPVTVDLSSWTGEWDTNDNGYKMFLQQTGDRVTGTYPYDEGRIEGRVVGNKLVGRWSEAPTYKPNRDAGDVEFTMSADGRSFTGKWRYGSEEPWRDGNPWNGKRANAPAVNNSPNSTSVNLALNRPARQSSTSEWSRPNDAQGAVDGVKNGSFGFHTNEEKNPWWQVDLGEIKPLTEIRIYNRLDHVPERARTIQILLSNDGVNFTRIFANDGSVFGGTDGRFLKVSLKGNSARYVRLQLNETTWFHLDEVEIY